MFLRCLLKRVKTQLRVPKMQRATFLNNIVTANTDFSRIFIKKKIWTKLKSFYLSGEFSRSQGIDGRDKGKQGRKFYLVSFILLIPASVSTNQFQLERLLMLGAISASVGVSPTRRILAPNCCNFISSRS